MKADAVTGRKTTGSRKTTWLAWFVCALTVGFVAATLLLDYLDDPTSLWTDLFGTLVLLAFATVGALIVSRRPGNRIGWLFCAGAVLWALDSLALEYGVYSLITAPHSLPGGQWVAWFGGWALPLGFFLLIVFVPLLFPNGRLPSPRWRFLVWFAIGYETVYVVLSLFAPTSPVDRLASVRSPLAVTFSPEAWNQIDTLGLLLGPIAIACVVSVLLRFRRAQGEEREQLKWFVYAAVMGALVFAFILISVVVAPSIPETIGGFLFDLVVAGFPIAVGIAILKYRLYEIDLLINRTFVYVPLTAILAGIFAASITLSQKIFIAFTGEKSDAATVLTTLVVVAVFDPLKSGLQHLVDRRFKEGRDPTQELHAIRDQANALLQVIDVEPSTRHLLDAAVRAFDAAGGSLSLQQNGKAWVVYTTREWRGDAALRVPLHANGEKLGELALGARRSGADYTERDRAALDETVAPVVRALALTARVNGGYK